MTVQPPNTTSQAPKKSDIIKEILADPSVKTVDWRSIMAAGVLADVHIERKRLQKHLSYRDLGLHLADDKEAKAMDDIFDLGMKNLLPREVRQRFDRIDDRGRRALEKNAIKTRLGYFIPAPAYFEWRAEMDQIEKDYFAARDEVFAEYEKLQFRVIQDYMKAAKSAYRLLKATTPDALDFDEQGKKAIFLRKAYDTVLAAFPTKDAIEASFRFEVETSYIDLSLLAGADEKSEVAEGISGAEIDELRWEQEAVKERRKLMEAMNADIVSRARKDARTKINAFLEEVVLEVRAIMYEACATTLSSIERNDGEVQGRSIFGLTNMLEKINRMKFFPDADIEKSMAIVRELIAGYSRPEKARTVSVSDVKATLGRIALVMRSTILPLGYEEREEREEALTKTRDLAGIPVVPDRSDVREAREALGFTMPSWDDAREAREEETYVLTAVAAGTASEERGERSW